MKAEYVFLFSQPLSADRKEIKYLIGLPFRYRIHASAPPVISGIFGLGNVLLMIN